ncbi:hypothetical protein [Sphingomonas cavernae]|uniref:DUF2214 domain-containing protein n=1 Tax=Sphingomonas cavernae TaxID=2320861 RepID=A0A418WK75_9SPHN|nr:hypothetical protein [Sphingomonas cavernae]RJF90415.1 hypothetical protein D3876_09210 [Sphingomonas cavernae]
MESLAAFATALQESGLGQWARGSASAYPAANLLHLLGFVLIVGGIGLLDLRIIGLFRALPLRALSRAVTPMAIAGIGLMGASGIVLFAADAATLVVAPLFQWKQALVALALANALGFRLLWNRALADGRAEPPAGARIMALASLLLWLAVAAAGRLIAYA